jgi:tetratricopeptide (TPR) repeat protein
MARITRASALLREGEREKALESLRGALELDHGEATLLAAGRAYLEAGDDRRAGEQQSALARDPLPEPQAEAGILEGERLLAAGKPGQAIAALKKSQALIDSWLVHFDLGRADVTSGAFAEADAELEQCSRREGESAALFLDEVPTLHLYPAVLYWRGRAQEGLGSRGAADFYRGYIALRERGEQDPLLDDARRRLSALR